MCQRHTYELTLQHFVVSIHCLWGQNRTSHTGSQMVRVTSLAACEVIKKNKEIRKCGEYILSNEKFSLQPSG